jgi:hypothetical protein
MEITAVKAIYQNGWWDGWREVFISSVYYQLNELLEITKLYFSEIRWRYSIFSEYDN